ncbi:MAG: class D sortase [Ruminococcus sp.]|nr:class D sortase [Ruminococcus sp.]
MADEKNRQTKPTPKPVLIITPVLLFIICVALTVLLGITPYNKFVTYLNVAFSDKMGNTTSAADDIVVSGDIKLFEKDSTAATSKEGKVVYPAFGEQYAMLSCEAINLYVPVYWGSSEELLKNGACQLSASAVIGDKGNTVIDAHVNTFFADLDKLKEGDIVKLSTSYGEFSYKVVKQAIFEKTDKKYVSQTKEDKLTLYTCVKQLLGSSTQRVAVICEPTEKAFYN